MPTHPALRLAASGAAALFALSLPAGAKPPPAPRTAAPAKPAGEAPMTRQLPPEVLQALQRVGVPADALSAVLIEADSGHTVVSARSRQPQNPASLMKLLTTAAALDRLGPAFSWATPVWLNGPVQGGVLEGSLHIKGSGDPKLVLERVWLLLRRVQQLGVREIRGDIVLDNSAFSVPDIAPGDFDGEPLRPYNVRPGALLLNYRTVVYTFVPDTAAGVARVLVEPPLAGAAVDRSVPLAPGLCGDWRSALQANFGDTAQTSAQVSGPTRFAGRYAASCGELSWPVADPQPATYDARLIEGLWREMGGQLAGRVREGPAPTDLRPAFEQRSPQLAELVRDINKFSNNVMAQQLFLTLALQANPSQPATPEAAREALRQWLADRTGEAAGDMVIDNGSGLSRDNRVSAQLLARVLLRAWDSPVMSELMSSLPISGIDGTMRRSRTSAGRAHLKTGTLRDVTGLAGYVLTNSGRRYVLAAIVNHPNAPAARPALEALVQWTIRDLPLRAIVQP
jgi:D-alanyl-D-alanine carboxypeptidase/D-alanyl-D-alanine-endopeptidase (penicillin-binding protein 4)